MSEKLEHDFLDRLYKVVSKLSNIAMTQFFRLKKLWEAHFSSLDIKPHEIRTFSIDKDKFFNDIEYLINILKKIADSQIDGYYSIKSILEAFYEHYFIYSESFKNEYSYEDQIILKYLAAKEILGNLVQYNKLDHETVALKYNIIARDYYMIKLRGIDLSEVEDSLKKINKTIKRETLISILKEIERDEIINLQEWENDYLITLNKDLILSEEGNKKYNQNLRSLIDWPTQFWRSYYNIRELNMTPSSSMRYNDLLTKILSKSATQGFGPAHFVFKNLIKYFKKIKESNN